MYTQNSTAPLNCQFDARSIIDCLPTIHTHNNFGQIRTIARDGEPWFVAHDVATILGYAKPENAIARHCKAQTTTPKQGGGYLTIIPERDLYRLIMRSKLPAAEQFEEWVVGDVLPSIRKTGGYIAAGTHDTDDEIMARALLVAQDTLNRRDIRIKTLEVANKTMQPKALFADAVSASTSSILVGELSKILRQNGIHTGQNRLFAWLRDNGYLIRRKGSDFNMPTQKSMELGLFEIKERIIANSDNSIRITKTSKVTGKGQQYFINMFLGQAGE